MMVNWAQVRKDFPITKRFTYLDHASASPMPAPIYQAVRRYYDELGGFADFSWNRWIARREEIREKVARFIHAEPDEIAFTTSASHGINLIAELIAEKGGVLTNDLEFPATTIPWIHRRAKLKFLKSENGTVPLALIKRNLKPQVKTILTSFVQYQTGFRQNLEALGQIKGNRFLAVNATQGFGYLPIDVKRARIDFLAANSYKWLMAGYGGGILYANRKWIRKFKPESAGWRSVRNPEAFNNRKAILKNEASRYELGCPPFPHIFAIGAALDYINRIGLTNIAARIYSLTEHLIDRLKVLGLDICSSLNSEYRSGIVVFSVKNAQKLTNQLLAKRIYVSARGEGIRVAPHFYNNEEDINRLAKALKEEMRK
jgi:cysteine desulfurase / selenocysteine lyase